MKKKIFISNDCLASFITRDCVHEEHSHPFTWCVIKSDDFVRLINNFDTINFDNYKCLYDDTFDVYYVLIDNLVRVNYVHYKYSQDAAEIERTKEYNFTEIHYRDILTYIEDCYKRRVARLKDCLADKENYEFIFIYSTGVGVLHNETSYSIYRRISNDMSNLNKINDDVNYKIYLFSFQDYFEMIDKKNKISFINRDNFNGDKYNTSLYDKSEFVYNEILKDGSALREKKEFS